MRRTALLLIMVTALGCGDSSEPIDGIPCQRDSECPEGNLCRQGQCSDAVTCRTDDDCFYGEECQQAECVRIEGYCERNGDCPSGQACARETNMCVSDDTRCADDDDCRSGEICDRGECIQDENECDTDDDCRRDEECVRNRCEPAPECRVDGDCPEGQVCDASECIDPDECQNDGDCDEGQICDRSQCTEGCREDADCDSGFVCEDARCVENSATCTQEPSLCGSSEECCEGECVTRGQCNQDDCTNNPGLCGPSDECCDGVCVSRGDCQSDYWAVCTGAEDCSSGLCLGSGSGRCTQSCIQRGDCPQFPSSLCIQNYHIVTHVPNGDGLVGLCYADDTSTPCTSPDNCFDGICLGRIQNNQADAICSIRCEQASDCLPGYGCGPMTFEIDSVPTDLFVCMPLGAPCSGTDSADMCYSQTCVDDDEDELPGVCTTFCTSDAACPSDWFCHPEGICWQ